MIRVVGVELRHFDQCADDYTVPSRRPIREGDLAAFEDDALTQTDLVP
jgi:hypothetical protein